MNVTVVWATPDVQDIVPVALPAGATVADAVAQSKIIERYALDAAATGICRVRSPALPRCAALPTVTASRSRGRSRPTRMESRRRRARSASKARIPSSR
jgi:hypothetical protein